MVQMVVRAPIVASCIRELTALRINPTFVGYLCLKRIAAREQSTEQLRFDYNEFYRFFLRMPGGPPGRPNFRPFWHQRQTARSSPARFWMHDNPAGTYSAASAARIQRFLQVVDIAGFGEAARYSLRPRHWELALRHLLYATKVPLIPLVIWLYRDFAFDDANGPSVSTVVSVFRAEFGYPATNVEGFNVELDHLYEDDLLHRDTSGWLEALP